MWFPRLGVSVTLGLSLSIYIGVGGHGAFIYFFGREYPEHALRTYLPDRLVESRWVIFFCWEGNGYEGVGPMVRESITGKENSVQL